MYVIYIFLTAAPVDNVVPEEALVEEAAEDTDMPVLNPTDIMVCRPVTTHSGSAVSLSRTSLHTICAEIENI